MAHPIRRFRCRYGDYRWNDGAARASNRLTRKCNIYPLTICAIIIVSNNNRTRNGGPVAAMISASSKAGSARHNSVDCQSVGGAISHDWCVLNVSNVCQTVSMRAESVRVSFTPPVALMSPPQGAAALICTARYQRRAQISTRRRALTLTVVWMRTASPTDRSTVVVEGRLAPFSVDYCLFSNSIESQQTHRIPFRANQRLKCLYCTRAAELTR